MTSRVGQAGFLLAGIVDTCSAAETAAVRESFLLQPRYFQQEFKTAFVSESMVVVDKPFDTQISHGKNQMPRFHEERSVAEGLAALLGGTAESYKRCHNLDFATSGALVMARSPAALKAGMQAFDHSAGAPGRVRKEYVAVMLGWPEWDSITINATIETDPTSAFKMRVSPARNDADVHDSSTGAGSDVQDPVADAGPGIDAASASPGVVDVAVAARWGPSRMPPAPRWSRDARAAKARESITEAHVVRRGTVTLHGPLHGAKATLIRLLPHTGRRHQLRVHMAHLGHPLLGDVSYAGDISTHRLCLHAVSVTFEHGGHEVAEGQGTPAAGEHDSSQHLPPSGLCISTKNPFDSFVT